MGLSARVFYDEFRLSDSDYNLEESGSSDKDYFDSLSSSHESGESRPLLQDGRFWVEIDLNQTGPPPPSLPFTGQFSLNFQSIIFPEFMEVY